MNYKIPEGAKEISVTETEGRIVVEFVNPPKFKEGDIIYKEGRIMIVKSLPSSYHFNCWPYAGQIKFDGSYGYPFDSPGTRLASPDEAKQLFDALKKEGKKWNAEKMCVEEITEAEAHLKKIQKLAKDLLDIHNRVMSDFMIAPIKETEGK